MSCILEQCYNQFIEEFPESWLPNGSEDESVFFNKNVQVESFFETCFILLSKSIICGEYINVHNFISDAKVYVSYIIFLGNRIDYCEHL